MRASLWFVAVRRSVFVLTAAACMQAAVAAAEEMADLSLEELGDIEVTSVSRRAERLQDAPAAVFVITSADIRRSTATTLAEALRLAPNLDIAQVNASSYAISARGFNNSLGNKLLVLIDGRTVYSPIFSGVNWDTQQVMLEDIDRIEVISGPGGTMWGANAVNGVINVITKSASDTQGGLVSALGSNNSSNGSFRYGGKVGSGRYRVYAMGQGLDNTNMASGADVPDKWHNRQAGFRADWGTASEGMTFQGDTYDAYKNTTAGGANLSGANLLARLNRRLDDGSQLRVQAYYDQTKRDDPTLFHDQEETYDLEFQHGFDVGEQHKILWGGGTRYTSSVTQAYRNDDPLLQLLLELQPPDQGLHWSNIFVQDEIALTKQLGLTLGLKAERNSYTGLEYLPSARLAWKLDDKQLLWSGLSRSVRAPARIDRDFFVSLYLPLPPKGPAGDIAIPVIAGGPDFQSEVVNAFEIGYRAQPTSGISYSLTAYYNEYDYLRSGESTFPAHIQNKMEATTYGIEAWGNYQATSNWRLSGGMKTFQANYKIKAGSTDPDGGTDAGNDASHTLMLRSLWNMTSQHDLDIMVRYVPALPDPVVPAYTAVDVRLAWQPNRDFSLSLIGQNLFDPGHSEFYDSNVAVPRSEIGRRLGLIGRWAF